MGCSTGLFRGFSPRGVNFTRAVIAFGATVLLLSMQSMAAPAFPLPNPAAHPPGFAVHLPPTGPTVLLPGGAIGPIGYVDGLPSPDLHHWEVEIHNPGAPMGFNVGFAFPGGPAAGFLTLGPGASVYFDIHVIDVPPEVGLWSFSASSTATMLGPVLVDTDVIEYPGPVGTVPGLSGMLFAGGGSFGPSVPGAPTVSLGVAIPEPASLMLLAVAASGALMRRRRD